MKEKYQPRPKALLVNPSWKDLEASRNLNPTFEFLALDNRPHAQVNNGPTTLLIVSKNKIYQE